MKVEEVIKVLADFNKWRRGAPPYEWHEDPAKQKDLPYSAKEIGVAIDEAVAMLRQKADDMDREEKREKKYEYTLLNRAGLSVWCTENKIDRLRLIKEEDETIVRRTVGEWEEVKE